METNELNPADSARDALVEIILTTLIASTVKDPQAFWETVDGLTELILGGSMAIQHQDWPAFAAETRAQLARWKQLNAP